MKKTRDYLYLIFVGLILYICAAIILGGISFFVETYVGIDFISVILYFLVSIFITRQVLKGISIRNKFVSIILPLYTALMYILKDFIAIFIIYFLDGASIIDAILLIPRIYYLRLITAFSFDFTVDGVFTSIINALIYIIDILIMCVGIYNSYKITKRE
ncbi:hypothetical protein J6Y73_05540 [bacterium]|nr:hypothetical protein [bacterium]